MKKSPAQLDNGAGDDSERLHRLATLLGLASIQARLHSVTGSADSGFELQVASSVEKMYRIDIGPPDGRSAWRALPGLSLGYGGHDFDGDLRALLEHLAGELQGQDFDSLALVAQASVRKEPPSTDPWHEVDELLVLNGWLDPCLRFDPQPIYAELRDLADQRVMEPQRGDKPGAEKRWASLALRSRGGVDGVSWTKVDDLGPDGKLAPWRWTGLASRCPVTVAMLDRLVDMQSCGSIHVLFLAPGGQVELHSDEPDKRCSSSLSIAVDHPDGCLFQVEDSSGRLVTVPFDSGAAILVNVAHRHCVSHQGERDRVHIVARGRPRARPASLLVNSRSEP